LLLQNSGYCIADFEQTAVVLWYAMWYKLLWNSRYNRAIALHSGIWTNQRCIETKLKLKFSSIFLIFAYIVTVSWWNCFYFQIKCHLTAAYRYPHSGFIPNLLMQSQLAIQWGYVTLHFLRLHSHSVCLLLNKSINMSVWALCCYLLF